MSRQFFSFFHRKLKKEEIALLKTGVVVKKSISAYTRRREYYGKRQYTNRISKRFKEQRAASLERIISKYKILLRIINRSTHSRLLLTEKNLADIMNQEPHRVVRTP